MMQETRLLTHDIQYFKQYGKAICLLSKLKLYHNTHKEPEFLLCAALSVVALLQQSD